MSLLWQVLPFIAVLVGVIGLAVLVTRLLERGTTPRRPREDASLQHHQQSSRSHIGGSGF
jgi:hypothetical protein